LLIYNKSILFSILKKSPENLLLTSIYLPGAITIVGKACENIPKYLKDYKNRIAVRVPKEPTPIHLIKAFRYLVSTSANISDSESSNNINNIADQFENSRLYVLGETTILKKNISSTVVEIERGKLIIHRIGNINPFDIYYRTNLRLQFKKKYQVKILFVCSGNTCRSPVAAFIAKKYSTKNISVKSAGINIKIPNSPLSENMDKIIQNKYNKEFLHQSSQISENMIYWADIILVMEKEHKDMVIKNGGLYKTFLLSNYDNENNEIPDPWEKDLNFYKKTFNIIKNSVENFLDSFDQY